MKNDDEKNKRDKKNSIQRQNNQNDIELADKAIELLRFNVSLIIYLK